MDRLAARDPFDSSPLRQLLVSLVTIKIAGIILIMDPWGLQSFDVPKSLFSRATEWLIAGALVILLIRYGFGIVPRTRLHAAVGAFLLVSVLSALFAENRYIALFGDRERYEGLTFLVDMVVLYVAVAVAFRRSEDWALLAGAVGIATVLVLSYATLQYLGLDPISWTDALAGRPFSTFGHPDYFGHFLSLTFGASLAVGAFGRGLVPVPIRIAAGLFVPTLLAVGGVVATRGTLVAAAAVLAVWPFLYVRVRGGGRRAAAEAAASVILSVVVIATILVATPLGERARALGDPARLSIYATALRAFVDRPFLGYGPDNFGVAYIRYHEPAVNIGYANSAHNWVLQAAVTVGASGLIALTVLLASFAWSLWGLVRREGTVVAASILLAAVGYWVHALVSAGSISVDWLPWVGFGFVASARDTRTTSPRRMGAAAWIAAGVVAMIAALGASTGVSALMANRDAAIAAGFADVRADLALAAAEAAVQRDPGRAEYWYWLGVARVGNEKWSDAASAYSQAADRAPYEWTYWANLAKVRVHQAQAGDPSGELSAAALAAAEQATASDPHEPAAYVQQSESAYALGRYDLALQSAVTAISLNPRGGYDDLAVRAAARALDQSEAKHLLEKALLVRESAVLHVGVARTALRLGDFETARAHARRTLDLSPGDAAALEILRAIP